MPDVQDFDERKAKFLEQYKSLIDELKVDIMAIPIHLPDGQGGFRLVVQQNIVDTKNVPTPSKMEDFI